MRWLLAACLLSSLSLDAKPPQPSECVECHDTVNLERFRTRAHGGGGLVCVDCHTAIKAIPHDEKLPPVRCARCHRHEAEDYALSVHGKARKLGNAHAPTCTVCHGPAHEIVSKTDPESRVARRNMATTCGKCHKADFLADLEVHLPRRASRMGIQKGDLK